MPLLLAFFAAAVILTVTPGVDTAMVPRAATVDGRKPALLAAAGIALGCLIWGAAVSLGLRALLRASELGYHVVKFANAAYLLWLGVTLLLKPRSVFSPDEAKLPSPRVREAFWRGFLTNLLNPKVGVFYVTFLPQFVPAGANVAVYSYLLTRLHVGLTLGWFGVLVTATVPLGRFLRQPSAMKTLDRLTGGIFIAFGVKLAASRNI